MKPIPHSKPWLTEADYRAVLETLKTGMLAQGKLTREFEGRLSEWVGMKHDGVAIGSGGAALVLALLALGIGKGDEVVLPTYVCVSVLEAVLTTGATPIMCDVSSQWVMSAENVSERITYRTKAIIVPHMYGIFADVESLRLFRVPVIEDCAQAVGYQGTSRIYGDIAIFSFHPTKCLTTGEGGMTISADSNLLATMRRLRDGFANPNGRLFSPMSDQAAALGLSQLSRYHLALDRRRELALGYKGVLERINPKSIQDIPFHRSMFFRFPVKMTRGLTAYQELFAKKNICIRRGVDKLLHRLLGLSDEGFETSVQLFDTTLSLPIYPALTDSEYSCCVEAVSEILSKET